MSHGSFYFFDPDAQSARPKVEEDDFDDDVGTAQINPLSLDLALTEIFNFYARRYRDKHEDFE